MIAVKACAVCRTDLQTSTASCAPRNCRSWGHVEIVGTAVETGAAVDRFQIGDRVGVPWLGWTFGVLPVLHQRAENPLRPCLLHGTPPSRR